ncbi:MAG TPA: hypothetical protein VH165_09020 [Kofleriaceae bacterium]|jgi:hypothetical protein|nr:hypothetical protein [Kofleriaceae bacterium]
MAAVYTRRRPSAFSEAISRHIRFLRVAAQQTAQQTIRVWTLVAARDRDPVRPDIAAMCRVVRVRMSLTPDEQHAFDQIVGDYPRIMLGLFVDRSDAEALEAVQQHLASVALTIPPVLPE